MKFDRQKEYRFIHDSGHFTGFVEAQADDQNLIKVLLTSRANANSKVKEGMYLPGEIRFIKASTSYLETGKSRLQAMRLCK